jgi:predicted esterase
MSWMTSFCNSSSPALAIQAQERLLKHFLKRSTFEVRTSGGHELNYVVIQRAKESPRPHVPQQPRKERTLIMMHGFGTGLGLFYGKKSFLLHKK